MERLISATPIVGQIKTPGSSLDWEKTPGRRHGQAEEVCRDRGRYKEAEAGAERRRQGSKDEEQEESSRY